MMTADVAPRIVTAEDNPIARTHLRLALEDAGFDVVADACDGDEAIEFAREHRPDLMVIDLGLPVVDGVDVIRRIVDERPLPIVVLTGRSPEDAADALEAGAVSLVHKPVGGDEVVAAVQAALAPPRRRSLRALASTGIDSTFVRLDALAEWADELAVECVRMVSSLTRRD